MKVVDPPQVEPRWLGRIEGKRFVFARIEDGGSPGRPIYRGEIRSDSPCNRNHRGPQRHCAHRAFTSEKKNTFRSARRSNRTDYVLPGRASRLGPLLPVTESNCGAVQNTLVPRSTRSEERRVGKERRS